MRRNWLISIAVLSVLAAGGATRNGAESHMTNLWVDPEKGREAASGTQKSPCRSISAALDLLPETLTRSVTIHLAGADYSTTGGQNMPAERLELMRRMRLATSPATASPR